jgi:hypothetical protein
MACYRDSFTYTYMCDMLLRWTVCSNFRTDSVLTENFNVEKNVTSMKSELFLQKQWTEK